MNKHSKFTLTPQEKRELRELVEKGVLTEERIILALTRSGAIDPEQDITFMPDENGQLQRYIRIDQEKLTQAIVRMQERREA